MKIDLKKPIPKLYGVVIVFSVIVGLASFTLYTYWPTIIESATQNKVINPDRYEYKIPAWIKGIAGFWAEGFASDEEYFATLQWLIDHGHIEIKQINAMHEFQTANSSLICEYTCKEP